MYEDTKVQHPHGNHESMPSHGVHVGKEGHGPGRTYVKDPGGHTSRGEHGGSIPGGTSHDEGHGAPAKVTKGTV